MSVQAEVTKPDDTQKYPFSVSGVDYDQKFETWDALKEGIKKALTQDKMWYVNVDVWRDVDESFGTWDLKFSNDDGVYKKIVVLRLNGHKINGDSINVNHKRMQFRIYDETFNADGLSYSTTAPYTITNTNTGLITLTGCIKASNGSRVVLESGCVKSTSSYAFAALGGFQTTSFFSSQVVIKRGFVEAKECCVLAEYKGASVTINGAWTDEYSNSTNGNPILWSHDNAVVSGNGGEGHGNTEITLGKCVLIGNITTPNYAACGVYHPQKGKLTIGEGAQIIAYSPTTAAAGVVMRAGELNMTGGTIIADGNADAVAQVGDNKPWVPSSGIVFDPDANYPDRATLKTTVSGGTISGNHSAVELINDKGNYKQGQISLKGGTYNTDVAQFAGDGYGLVRTKNESGEYEYSFVEGREAMTVNADGIERYYNSLSYVLENKGVGTTTKLLGDVTVKDKISVDNTGVTTLDLNGYTLSIAKGHTPILSISNPGTLIIDDSQGTGCVKTNSNDYSQLFEYNSVAGATTPCVLKINGGTFTTKTHFVGACGNFKESPFVVYIYGGNINSPAIFPSGDHYATGYLYGGEYSASCYLNEKERLADGYAWKETGSTNYPYRVVRDIRVTYNTESILEADENGRYIIDLKENADAPLTKLSVAKDAENVDVAVRKYFNTANEWKAFYAPFALKVTDELLEKFEVAKIWDTELQWEGETPQTTIELIKLKAGEAIPAFTPCLIRAKEAGVQDITADNVTLGNTNDTRAAIACATVEQNFTFTGVLADKNIYNKYALSDGGLVLATNKEAVLSPFKFYMTITDKATREENTQPKMVNIRVIGEETNGINDVNEAATRVANGKVYTLQGTLVGTSLQGLPAGIYVQNGRKYVVK